MGFGPLTLLLPEATEARRGPQLPGFGLLTAGHVEGLVQTRLRLRHLLPFACLRQQELTLKPMQFGSVAKLGFGGKI
jgi:hypothetical protein